MDRKILKTAALGTLLAKLQAAGQRLVGPVERDGAWRFVELTKPPTALPNYVQTVGGPKPLLFPRYETLLSFQQAGRDVTIDDALPPVRPTVLFGVRPCDAAAVAVLRGVLTWDSPDPHFESKQAALTIIGLSCTAADEFCFCTSVGCGPGATAGSDLLLTPMPGEQLLVEVLTDKGQAVVAAAPELFTAAEAAAATRKDAALAKVKLRFDAKAVAGKLPKLFDQPLTWLAQSARCLGCGACAFVCPTCTCFDIQPERGRDRGVHQRCWDACGFSLFTLHASGHNPRTKQSERWRQRVMHKFAYQPERLRLVGCVGCGRCSRACPVDMNLAEHVQTLAETTV
jgi:ferredoxin